MILTAENQSELTIVPEPETGPGGPIKSAMQRLARKTGSPSFSVMTEGIAAAMVGEVKVLDTPTTRWRRCERDYWLQQLAARLMRVISNSQQRDNIGGRCFVIAADGSVFGVIWTTRQRVGVVLRPHPGFEDEWFQDAVNHRHYVALLNDLLPVVDSIEESTLSEQVKEVRARIAAALLPSPAATHERADVQQLKEAIAEESTEFYLPARETKHARTHEPIPFKTATAKAALKQLFVSYESTALSEINYNGAAKIPDRREVIRIARAFLPILFPGYYGPQTNNPDFKVGLRHRWASIRRRLSDQIRRTIRFARQSDDAPDSWDRDNYDSWSMDKADALLSEIPRLRWKLARDVEAAA
jgi:hypothetical protein